MGYPPHPQDPYGQQPQQPYGYTSGPQYGQQPPPRRNTAMILLLAVGLPLLVLGGCAAVVLTLVDSGRDAVVTQADPPNMVISSSEPTSVSEEPRQEAPSTAAAGGTITLQGIEPGLQVAVTLTKFVDPATPAQEFIKPKAGSKFVAVEIMLKNVGQAVYSDSPSNGATLIDSEGQQHRSTFADIREGQQFGGGATVNGGDSRKGVIVYEVPESAKLVKLQFALNSGFADQKGEWSLS